MVAIALAELHLAGAAAPAGCSMHRDPTEALAVHEQRRVPFSPVSETDWRRRPASVAGAASLKT